jgi:hypothetical protein
MTPVEVNKDLFDMDEDYYLAHAISGDYSLGVGTAKRFDKEMNMRFELFKNYQIPIGQKYANVGCALLVGRVFNLVTKETRYDKETYAHVEDALWDMLRTCSVLGIKKIAMTAVGCGRDKLEWNQVCAIIEEVFGDTDIEVVVCRY